MRSKSKDLKAKLFKIVECKKTKGLKCYSQNRLNTPMPETREP